MFNFLVISLFSLTAPPPTIAPTCLEVTPTGNGGGVNTTLYTPTSGSEQFDNNRRYFAQSIWGDSGIYGIYPNYEFEISDFYLSGWINTNRRISLHLANIDEDTNDGQKCMDWDYSEQTLDSEVEFINSGGTLSRGTVLWPMPSDPTNSYYTIAYNKTSGYFVGSTSSRKKEILPKIFAGKATTENATLNHCALELYVGDEALTGIQPSFAWGSVNYLIEWDELSGYKTVKDPNNSELGCLYELQFIWNPVIQQWHITWVNTNFCTRLDARGLLAYVKIESEHSNWGKKLGHMDAPTTPTEHYKGKQIVAWLAIPTADSVYDRDAALRPIRNEISVFNVSESGEYLANPEVVWVESEDAWLVRYEVQNFGPSDGWTFYTKSSWVYQDGTVIHHENNIDCDSSSPRGCRIAPLALNTLDHLSETSCPVKQKVFYNDPYLEGFQYYDADQEKLTNLKNYFLSDLTYTSSKLDTDKSYHDEGFTYTLGGMPIRYHSVEKARNGDQCDLYLTVLGGEGDPHYFAPYEDSFFVNVIKVNSINRDCAEIYPMGISVTPYSAFAVFAILNEGNWEVRHTGIHLHSIVEHEL